MPSKPIEIFRAGRQTAMSGAVIDFSAADLAACADAYDPARHEAPLVVGHPASDAPAYGWVRSLAGGASLQAHAHQVDAAFAEMVAAGRFKKISASFYAPDSPRNPVPGVWYLRHVGFLGAQPPAVKGLRNPEFADGEEGVVEFGDPDNASLWRRLRDWMIGRFGLDEADKVLSDFRIAALELDAVQPELEPEALASPTYSEEETDVKPEEAQALQSENENLKRQLQAVHEATAKRERDERHAGHAAFAEKLVADGRLAPAHKTAVIASLDHIAAAPSVVEFGEDDAKQPLIEGLKAFYASLPKVVEFGEHATKGRAGAAGDGKPSDQQIAERARMHRQKIIDAGGSMSFAEAVDAVNAGKDQ